MATAGDVRGGGWEDLAVALEDSDSGVRRRAVRDLAQVGERECWELVVGALGDPKGEVADEAQFQLAKLRDEGLLGKLKGRQGLGAKDPLVRQRVAEFLGRSVIEQDGLDLLRCLARRDPEMSETLLWSVERLARAGRLGGDRERCARDLGKLARQSGDVRVRAQALCTLAAVDPSRVPALLPKALAAREHELRVAALECCRRDPVTEAAGYARRALGDEHGAVRLAALELLGALGTKEAVTLILECMLVEERLRLRVAALESLQRLSGRKHKFDERSWRRWIDGLPADWRPEPSAKLPLEFGGTVSFAGLPLLSDRLCFLIDFSGSLWYEREGRPARKGKVDELLRAALSRLDKSTEFNVIPYTARPHPWRESLVPADARHVSEALADFEACDEKGSGNVFDAVRLALLDRRVDRLVVFTDGAPTGGARWKLDLMMPLLEQATRFDRIAIDAIVVDAKPGLRKQWQRLAESTGGRCVAVDL